MLLLSSVLWVLQRGKRTDPQVEGRRPEAGLGRSVFSVCCLLFALFTLLTTSRSQLHAQSFFIRSVAVAETDQIAFQFDQVPGFYAVLSGAGEVTDPFEPVALSLGDAVTVPVDGPHRFYHVRWVDLEESEDLDRDGMPDAYELFRGLNPLFAADAGLDPDQDGANNGEEFRRGTDPNVADQVTVITTTSPGAGEPDVAITRETIIRFSDPLAEGDGLDPLAVDVSFAGEAIPRRLHRASDGRSLTIFYDSVLPPSARVRVTLDGDRLIDFRGTAVDADGDGFPGGVLSFDFDTLGLSSVPGTAVCGRVFASELMVSEDGAMGVNQPLAGVRITVDGMEDELFAVTDQNGNFRLDNAPVGRFFVHVDGRPASAGRADGAYYPFVGKTWESEAGVEVNVGEVFLPLVSDGTLQAVSAAEETTVGFSESVLETFPEFGDVALTVPPGALFADNGEAGGMVGIAPVDPERLPGPLPDGLSFPLVITVQTDGATNFDQPVPVCFPNLPDPATGRPLLPGETTGLWSFNHDTGEWEVVGSMTASFDGNLVCSDPGSGILAPGWHGARQGTQVEGGDIVRNNEESDDDSEPGSSSRARNCPHEDGDCPDIEEQDPGATDTDPIYLFSGEFYFTVEDLRIRGRGKDFVWSRKYRSKIGPKTAQGNGWDYSYNIFIERDGDELILADGDSRRDRYPAQSPGSFVREEFFREFVEVAPDTFHLFFSDRGRWEFLPFDGGPAAGKLAAIVDRNGNTIRVFYDAGGRLERIVDTLDREIRIGWNAEGLIETVTDFAGRVVRYEYFGAGDTNGNPGDLKAVISPAVTNTPTGNDFPMGKRVSYTYSTGFDDPRLNSNLLTITDGRRNDPNDPTFGEGPYLRNVYAEATDPDDLNYDRVIAQAWGEADDWIHLHYSRLRPSPSNGQSVLKAILNDRNGNVTETLYDARNRLTQRLEFTGRADGDLPTTPTANRPVRPLRSTDPSFFVTRYEWNEDSQLKRVVYPNGNEKQMIYESELNPLADPRARGNLRQVEWTPGTHSPAGDQEVIIQRFEYGTDFHFGCCNLNFVTAHFDGRGQVTRYEYDGRGNRVRTQHRIEGIVEEFDYNDFGQMISRTLPDNGSGHRRMDVYTYYEDGPQRGYRASRVEDAGGFGLTTGYEYDLVGNIVRQIDPKGQAMDVTVNALDQIVRKTSREVTPGGGVRYERDYHYDANNNVVRIDILNRDHTGAVQANRHFSMLYEYELLNRLIRRSQEISEGEFAVTEYEYDANRNRIVSRYGEAVSGNQAANAIQYQYDERDLLFRIIRGPGSPSQSTDEWSYDRNGNLNQRREGIEEAPRVFVLGYDGYDRKVSEIDPMGNEHFYRYDANHNRVGELVLGELRDGPGGEGNLRLREESAVYDALDRKITVDRHYFESESQVSVGDGVSRVAYAYTDNSQLLRVTNDNLNSQTWEYDTANRKQRVTDAAGNHMAYEYDANSNVIAVVETEFSDLGGEPEIFRTEQAYDGLDRMVRSLDNVGNVNEFAFDSRHNRVLEMDALRASPDGPGNLRLTEFDGLNRPVRQLRPLTDNGMGGGGGAGQIETQMRWDRSSRLVARVDDAGNETQFVFDPLNRMVERQHADGTRYQLEYDVHDNVVRTVDANGSEVRSDYDLLNRVTDHRITPGAGVSNDTTAERFEYDGRSRMVLAVDDDSEVSRAFDSLSNVVAETLNEQTTTMAYDGVRNRRMIRYPGGREIDVSFDRLERSASISDQAGVLATQAYVGPGRLQQRVRRNGTTTDYFYDGVKRPSSTVHFSGTGEDASVIDQREYAWDPAFNKRSLTVRTGGGMETTDYEYDSVYRLTGWESAGGDASGRIDLEFDGVGNRQSVSATIPDAEGVGAYSLNGTLPEPGDRQVNQYSNTPFGQQQHDANGNRVMDPVDGSSVSVVYDYQNRMVAYGQTRYRYDALGRRIERREGNAATRFFYANWQVCEEQDADGGTLATYVYGPYVDDVIQMERGGQTYYHHADDRYSVNVLSNGQGEVVERYDYAPYGGPSIRDGDGEPLAESGVGNAYLFQGRRFDPESGWYFYRKRYLDPRSGRFTTRDPMGMWRTAENTGNGYTFVGNNPATTLDPFGLDREIVLGPHAYITVDVYDAQGNKTGTRDLHFSPEVTMGTASDDWTVRTTKQRLFYHDFVVRINVPSTREEDQLLLREWRSRKEQRWNPIYNCWWATLTSYDVGISRDRNWDALTDWGSFLYNMGEVDIIREGDSGSEASIRPYEPTITEQISQGIDQGLEYLEENVAQPIVDFFDDPAPALESLGNSFMGLFSSGE